MYIHMTGTLRYLTGEPQVQRVSYVISQENPKFNGYLMLCHRRTPSSTGTLCYLTGEPQVQRT